MSKVPAFDVFAGKPDRDAVWICRVKGLAIAKQLMDNFAAEKPGPYFVFFAGSREVLAQTDTSYAPQAALLRYPQLQMALQTLREMGHSVGPIAMVDEEPRLTVDDHPRTYDEILHMVEQYNRRQA